MRVWELDEAAVRRMSVGALVLGLVGSFGYASAWLVAQQRLELSFTLWGGIVGLLITVGLGAVLALVHEAIHGAVMLICGAVPRFGAAQTAGVVYLYATAPGHLFTRAQYVVVATAPLVMLGTGLLAWVVWGPWGGWLVLPAAVHLSGCAGDLIIVREVLREPPGTRVEDRRTGAAFHPAGPAPLAGA